MQKNAPAHLNAASRAERRQITVMFCDLVGSTEMSVRYDPEDMRALLTRYRQACARAIRPYNGFISQYLGDGILVYFGYPKSHEHDAERAVRAAQDVVRNVAALSDPPLKVCIGVATGTVVVGDIVGDGVTELDVAVGQTPNLAARLMGLASENQIVLDHATRSLIGDVFHYQDLGPQDLKGFREPVQIWGVQGPPKVKSHSHAVHNMKPLVPLIARDEELARLSDCWEKTKAGNGQVVLMLGEPGIGKSRLTRHFQELVEGERAPPQINKFYCAENSRSSTLRPIVDKIVNDSEIQAGDTEDAKMRKLRELFLTEKQLSRENVSIILNFLSLENSLSAGARMLSPEERKDRIFAILEEHICNYVRDRPALLIVEDLHWCDGTTLELLERVVTRRVQHIPLLILLTARSEFLPTWPDEHFITQIAMKRFSTEDAEAFLEKLSAKFALPAHMRTEVILRGDRNPLFLEEVFKAASENFKLISQTSQVDRNTFINPIGVPNSLASSLMERLDRLGDVKTVAQAASAIGHRFSADVLEHVGGLGADDLRDALMQLIDSDVVVPVSGASGPQYAFKHALLRDAAYTSLLHSESKRLHALIADTLIAHFPEAEMREPEQLAYHFARGGKPDQAIEFWRLAGQRARERHANAEALEHINAGLDLLKTMPDTEVWQEQEVELRTSVALALTALHGGGSAQVRENYARARQLTQSNSNTSEHFRIMVGSWLNSFIGGELYDAQSLSHEVLALADRKNDPTNHIEANRVRGMTLFYAGEFSGARNNIETAVELHDPEHHSEHALTFGLDPLVCCQSYLAYSHLFLGDGEKALQLMQQAITAADGLAHPYTQAFARAFSGFVHQNLDQYDEALALARKTIKIAKDNEFQFWARQQNVVQAWALAHKDISAADDMFDAANVFLENSSTIGSTRIMCMTAEIQLQDNQLQAARATLDKALGTANKSGEKFYLAEIHRLEAKHCLIAKGEAALAEMCSFYSRSLSISEYQEAGMWQRRTSRCIAEACKTLGRQEGQADEVLNQTSGPHGPRLVRETTGAARRLLENLAS